MRERVHTETEFVIDVLAGRASISMLFLMELTIGFGYTFEFIFTFNGK
jgi:hypothetical protein